MLLLVKSYCVKKLVRVNQQIKEVPLILGLTIHFQQIFTNIILNAIEAMQESKKRILSVNINLKKSKNESLPLFIEVNIKDTGKGLEKKDIKEVFKPFVTKKPDNLGLGLSIVVRILNLYKGHIDFISKKNKGTHVKIQIPIEKQKPNLS